MTLRAGSKGRSRWLVGGCLGAAAVLALAACGKKTTGATGSASSSNPDADITVMATNVPGVGTVLVNGNGRTLYILTSEAGGKVTCTDANNCTKAWPDTELPSGMTAGIAGSGIQTSMLSTTKGPTGDSYVTYAGYPLYTFSGDSGNGMAHGQNITSFGGTWETMKPNGTPVTGPATTTSSNSNSGGY
ncbi:MAG TPA: hypothetical protein VFW71_04985 [Actinomycetota bacterium]|nr:hypothetical protein [Actinomycetota bacterium]